MIIIKKNNTAIAIFIIIFGIGSIIAILVYSNIRYNSEPRLFNESRKMMAQRLYDKMNGYDFIDEYPKTAEELMEISNDMFKLVYGDMIIQDEILREVITNMRMLYSNEILDKNDFDSQYNEVVNNLEQLKKSGTYCISVEQEAPIYEAGDKNSCYIRVVQYTSNYKEGNNNMYYWVYELEKSINDNKWKITGWYPTDKNFNIR